MTLKILTYPDPILAQKSELVVNFNEDLLKTAEEMFLLMKSSGGIGLAAPQVGILKRFFVMECEGKRIAFVNPTIIQAHDDIFYEESCLSFPAVKVKMPRKNVVGVRYFTPTGKEMMVQLMGLSAICFQHEYDHLNGITFENYISDATKEFLTKRGM